MNGVLCVKTIININQGCTHTPVEKLLQLISSVVGQLRPLNAEFIQRVTE